MKSKTVSEACGFFTHGRDGSTGTSRHKYRVPDKTNGIWQDRRWELGSYIKEKPVTLTVEASVQNWRPSCKGPGRTHRQISKAKSVFMPIHTHIHAHTPPSLSLLAGNP